MEQDRLGHGTQDCPPPPIPTPMLGQRLSTCTLPATFPTHCTALKNPGVGVEEEDPVCAVHSWEPGVCPSAAMWAWWQPGSHGEHSITTVSLILKRKGIWWCGGLVFLKTDVLACFVVQAQVLFFFFLILLLHCLPLAIKVYEVYNHGNTYSKLFGLLLRKPFWFC